jgi:hypothetical protein
MVKVVFAKDCANEFNLPDIWPKLIFADDHEIEYPYTNMSSEELEIYKLQNMPFYTEWETKHVQSNKKLAYENFRRESYPSVGDQLDMLYKAMKLGILPEVPDFMRSIDAVKEKYPKP